MVKFLYYVFIGYFCTWIYLQFSVNSVAFQPPSPSTYSDTDSIIKLKTANSDDISAVYLPAPNTNYVLLYSHGNAVDLGGMLPILNLYQRQGYSIFCYDYPGYGTSTGKPSESRSNQAADSAYQYLVDSLNISPEHIIVYGKSIGTAMTLHLASTKQVGGVILESPMLSAFRVFTQIPIFPLDRLNNARTIMKISAPLLIIHGTADRVIPLTHGITLFEKAVVKKFSYWPKGYDHNDVLGVRELEYWQKLNDFLSKVEAHQKMQ